MLKRPLDPGYAAAADRREAQGRPRSTSLRSPLLAVATVLIGLLVGVASYNLTTANQPRSQARARPDHPDRGPSRRGRRTRRQVRHAAGPGHHARGRTPGHRRGHGPNRALSVAVGTVPLQGPGFKLTLDEPRLQCRRHRRGWAGPAGPGDRQGPAVRHERAVEGRWEAVSINGNRLTSTSAIRFGRLGADRRLPPDSTRPYSSRPSGTRRAFRPRSPTARAEPTCRRCAAASASRSTPRSPTSSPCRRRWA